IDGVVVLAVPEEGDDVVDACSSEGVGSGECADDNAVVVDGEGGRDDGHGVVEEVGGEVHLALGPCEEAGGTVGEVDDAGDFSVIIDGARPDAGDGGVVGGDFGQSAVVEEIRAAGEADCGAEAAGAQNNLIMIVNGLGVGIPGWVEIGA